MALEQHTSLYEVLIRLHDGEVKGAHVIDREVVKDGDVIVSDREGQARSVTLTELGDLLGEEVTALLEARDTMIAEHRAELAAKDAAAAEKAVEHTAALAAKDVEADERAVGHTAELTAKDVEADEKAVEHKAALAAKDADAAAKAVEHSKVLEGLRAENAANLEARDAAHQEIIEAKDAKHAAALKAKDAEHTAALEKKDDRIAELEALQSPVDENGFPVLTPIQIRLTLLRAGVTSETMDGLIAAIPEASDRETARAFWEYSKEYHRDHPLIETFGSALGLTVAQVDHLWKNPVKVY